MSKSRLKTRWSLIVILLVACALTYAGYKYFFMRPTPVTIMAINPVPLIYGATTISGTLQKDAPAGSPGTFLIVLSDMRPVLLDVQGIDNLLGLKVAVSGILSNTSPLTMTVSSITVVE